MKLTVAGTGSSGNCYLLQRDNDRIIALDCGVPWKKVMVATKFRPTSIDFALVTHSHSDHYSNIGDFRRNFIDVFSPENLDARKEKTINGVSIIPFEVPHDVTCYGYLIRMDGKTIIYMTDFGYSKYTFQSWKVETWIIGCNHIELPDVDEAKYAHVVRGHSSLQTVKDILAINKTDALKNVIIVHYNEDADTERMRSEIQSIVGDGVNVIVAQKGATIDL